MPTGAALKNCYRARKNDSGDDPEFAVPQSFSFMAREGGGNSKTTVLFDRRLLSLSKLVCMHPAGMPGSGVGLTLDERVPRRLRSDGNAKDVFCCVKAAMSDESLIQDPILVLPQSLMPATQNFFNAINRTSVTLRADLEESRCDELRTLAKHLEVDFPHLQRGVN